jgi:hypothetical protein
MVHLGLRTRGAASIGVWAMKYLRAFRDGMMAEATRLMPLGVWLCAMGIATLLWR